MVGVEYEIWSPGMDWDSLGEVEITRGGLSSIFFGQKNLIERQNI